MDKKAKIFFLVFGLIIFFIVVITYWRMVIMKDYAIEARADCDSVTERCFVWRCDPESNIDGEKCVGNPEKDVWNYKIVKRNASRIPVCDTSDENCKPLVCGENEQDCEQIYCNDENKVEQGVECSEIIK